MKIVGFAVGLLLWLALVGVGYVYFGGWMLFFAAMGVLGVVARLLARKEAARKAARGTTLER